MTSLTSERRGRCHGVGELLGPDGPFEVPCSLCDWHDGACAIHVMEWDSAGMVRWLKVKLDPPTP